MNLRMNKRCWTLPLRQRSGPSSTSMTDMRDPILAPHCTAGIEKSCETVRRFGIMPMFVKTAVTDMHRCDSCMMWQSCAGYSKHLQNKSLSSVHWKWDKLTQGQLLVLHFAILHLARTRDQSSFHCSWLALLALSKGCVPSCFHHMCHGLTFSVSPIGAAVCSCQQAAFEVHLWSVGTKTASNQWRFIFQAHLFDHPDLLPDFQDHADAHEWMQNWQKLHFTEPQLKASLLLEGVCILLWWGYCNVNLGIVEAGAPPPAETRNCGAHRIKLRCSERNSSLEIFHVESEAAWNKNPGRAENYHCVPASLVI